MPICVVTLSGEESLNLTGCVTCCLLSTRAWKIGTEAVAHLKEQLLTPLVSHL